MNIFEQAVRNKLRFTTNRGEITVEDLWDVPLTSRNGFNLDEVAKGINRELKASEEESFVVQKSTANTVAQIQMDIVKYIIEVKLAEKTQAQEAAANREKRQKLLELKARKEDQARENLTIEEIDAQLAAID